ncbi:MAG: hypothetical protein ACXABY_04225 [Candidatus Thorarchaeota archaeon]|jgi:hypothetical protein
MRRRTFVQLSAGAIIAPTVKLPKPEPEHTIKELVEWRHNVHQRCGGDTLWLTYVDGQILAYTRYGVMWPGTSRHPEVIHANLYINGRTSVSASVSNWKRYREIENQPMRLIFEVEDGHEKLFVYYGEQLEWRNRWYEMWEMV